MSRNQAASVCEYAAGLCALAIAVLGFVLTHYVNGMLALIVVVWVIVARFYRLRAVSSPKDATP